MNETRALGGASRRTSVRVRTAVPWLPPAAPRTRRAAPPLTVRHRRARRGGRAARAALLDESRVTVECGERRPE